MRSPKNLFGPGALAVLLAAAAVLGGLSWPSPSLHAQSGTKADGTAIGEDDPEFAAMIWKYLEKSDYRSKWTRWPEGADGFTEGKSPHGAFLKVYVNDVAAKSAKDPAYQSVIVKENYDKDRKLVALTPMIRVREGYDPDHKDWYYAKFKPDGTLFAKDEVKLAGKVKGCIDCHAKAKGKDYLFTNDK